MKKRLLCPQLPTPGNSITLSSQEAHHAIGVYRLRDGDIVEAIDGQGNRAYVLLRTHHGSPKIESIKPDSHRIIQPFAAEKPCPVVLEIAILKGEAMEWVVEKSVELGIDKLVPVITDHTVVQIKTKGPDYFQNRWQKIADQALKQCGRAHQMGISSPTPLNTLLATPLPNHVPVRLWCDEKQEDPSSNLLHWIDLHSSALLSEMTILIGPEGGWSSQERALLLETSKYRPIHRIQLGPYILRSETAALFCISILTAQARSKHFSKTL